MKAPPLTRKPLTVRHQKYIDGVLAGKTGRQAAVEAGFAEKSADSRALELNKHPEIIAAVAKGREELRKASGYDVKAAFEELDAAMKQAAEAKQFNAVVKAIEAKSRMVGILDKPNPLVSINAAEILAAARGRIDAYRAEKLAEVQDVEAIDVAAAKARALEQINIFG